jgi:hypothetical protein
LLMLHSRFAKVPQFSWCGLNQWKWENMKNELNNLHVHEHTWALYGHSSKVETYIYIYMDIWLSGKYARLVFE